MKERIQKKMAKEIYDTFTKTGVLITRSNFGSRENQANTVEIEKLKKSGKNLTFRRNSGSDMKAKPFPPLDVSPP